jgi:hypothetical protein
MTSETSCRAAFAGSLRSMRPTCCPPAAAEVSAIGYALEYAGCRPQLAVEGLPTLGAGALVAAAPPAPPLHSHGPPFSYHLHQLCLPQAPRSTCT